jgi:hypothetical protein
MIKQILLASAIMQSVGQCSPTTEQAMPSDTLNRIADAIFRAEGTHSKHPYGVMIPCSSPRVVCINTIQHAWRDFEGEKAVMSSSLSNPPVKALAKVTGSADTIMTVKVSLPFIQFLGARYCPSSVDYVGYRNWTNNVWRIIDK